jgi:hypothetical protein
VRLLHLLNRLRDLQPRRPLAVTFRQQCVRLCCSLSVRGVGVAVDRERGAAQISMSGIKGPRTLRCWLAKAHPADEASAVPNLHRMTLSVGQHSLSFKHRHRIIGRIHVDLFGETIAA